MNLSLCGINYRTSSLEQREPLQINRCDLSGAVSMFKSLDGVVETAILTTCNRIEFYLVLDDSAAVFDTVAAFYSKWRNIDIGRMRTAFYTYQGSSTARHLFKVSAGVDSMVLGETQILGQVKEAYRIACSVKGPGKNLHKLFHIAFRSSKKVRSETEIGHGSTSVSGAALEMLSRYLNGDKNTNILCIGVSPMTEIALTQLLNKGYKNITLANRTLYKAEKLATRFGINYAPLGKLRDVLKGSSVVISCTGADKYIIDAGTHSGSLKSRDGKEVIIVDMALPRDVDPAVSEIDGVKVFDLEDIKHHISKNQNNRENAVAVASEIGEDFVNEFMTWQKNSAVEPLIRELINEMERIRRRELDQSKRKIPAEQWDEIERLSQALLKKVIDLPVRQLKEMNESGNIPADPIELFRELFKLKSSLDVIS